MLDDFYDGVYSADSVLELPVVYTKDGELQEIELLGEIINLLA